MKYDKSNIFAKILRGEIPCEKVYENKYVLSFYDINPKKKLHILIIPKGEYVDLDQVHQRGARNVVAFCCPFLKASLRSSFTFRARVRGSCLTRSVNGVAAVRGAANSHSSSLNRLEVLIKGVNSWCQVYTYSEV